MPGNSWEESRVFYFLLHAHGKQVQEAGRLLRVLCLLEGNCPGRRQGGSDARPGAVPGLLEVKGGLP